MTDRPAPLTPADCDLTDFAFMPLDVARLRDSELASNESPEACWAAVQLWAASWHQVPAGSIPNDDKWLAKHTGYGRIVKEWMRIRQGALRGWIECADGRLYHSVVSEKAREAWKAKVEQRYRTEVARVKKHNQRHGTTHTTPDFEEWILLGRPQGQHLSVPGDKTQIEGDKDRDKASKGKREGQGQGQGDSYSVTSVTGGKPPLITDPEEIIFVYGLSLLVNAGTSEKQARSFLGGLRKHHGDSALIDKLRECAKAKVLQPLEWLAAALPPGGATAKPNSQEALEVRNRKVAEEMIAEMAEKTRLENETV
jgi:hypothetical protein